MEKHFFIARQRLAELLAGFDRARVAVLGDLFLDRWVTVDPALDEPSVETGRTAFQVIRSRCEAGAAGTVLGNLTALGVGYRAAISLVGLDGHGHELTQALRRLGVDAGHVLHSHAVVTPTYMKPLFLQPQGAPVEGNRLDFKNYQPTPKALQRALIRRLRVMANQVDALIVLDQLTLADTGVVNAAVREAVCELARQNPKLIVYADSRAFIHSFRHVIIKCNNHEATGQSAPSSGDGEQAAFSAQAVFAAMDAMRRRSGRDVFITCNAHGVACGYAGQPYLIPAAPQSSPIDVCGAGDACSAGIVSALCAGATNPEAAFIGNLAAGVTVRKLGTTGTASQAEMWALYDEWAGA
ncbi:MAG: PfkB family carbohydrate kinase [Oscillospiraceae bacterium]|jgi:bifunctional ADP-heptose synthase (sugar kinase/adenylyltransferase)|nr:PfkB family carbohydrate kinase [Oscillospiraceae bacterium]